MLNIKTSLKCLVLLVGLKCYAQCPGDWSEWFKTNKTRFTQEEHNDLYKAFKYGCLEFESEYNSIVAKKLRDSMALQEKRIRDSISAADKGFRARFWKRWFDSNKTRYKQEELNSLYSSFSGTGWSDSPGLDTTSFLLLVQQTDSQKLAESKARELDLANKRNFENRHTQQIRAKFKRSKDRFGEFDFYSYNNVYSGAGYEIDLIVNPRDNPDIAHFYVRSTGRSSCFDDDARIVFLLKNNQKLEFESNSRFNCESFMITGYFSQGDFNSPVKAIRIDHGSNARGFEDFNTPQDREVLLHNVLSHIEWVQEVLYPETSDASNQ